VGYFSDVIDESRQNGGEVEETRDVSIKGSKSEEQMERSTAPQGPFLLGTCAPPQCGKFLQLGFAIFPVRRRDKYPLTRHGFKDASRDAHQVEIWAQKFPNCNWGIALGMQSRCFVLDFDSKDGAENFERQHGRLLPATYVIKTGRGTHHYFRLPDSGIGTHKFGGGELRSEGAYVVGEGSIHETGAVYTCTSNSPIAEFPSELLTKLRAKSTRKVSAEGSISKGERNDSLFHIAHGAARNGATGTGVLQLLRTENSRCIPPLEERELDRIVKSAVEHTARAKGEFPASASQTPAQSALETIDGCALLDLVKTYIRRYVSLTEAQARVIAVWVFHTYMIAIADATPYLSITSAEKQSGKTRLLEVLETIVDKPWLTGKVTAAVLPRKIEAECPTLLLDESDAAFGGDKEYSETLRGVLNSGYRVTGKTSCCEKQGSAFTFRDFSTFCAKAIAGIGNLPDTVADRAIHIRLKRARGAEKIERFRRRSVEAEADRLKTQIAVWCSAKLPELIDTRPLLPEDLTDRQQDVAEPLLAIADGAGGDWPDALRQSIVALSNGAHAADDSTGVQLLADIRQVLDTYDAARISSTNLIDHLIKIETSPWGEWSKGKPITPTKLARLLKPYEIAPHTIRIENDVAKGYLREDFADAWDRYLPPTYRSSCAGSVTAVTEPALNHIPDGTKVTGGTNVTVQTPQNCMTDANCNDVTAPRADLRRDGLVEVEI
jgi:hypothetical protein